MKTFLGSYLRGMSSIVVALSLGAAASVSARTLQVEAYGTDSSACGSQSPCRSISQAIENAANGDTILVGPGRYGDVNGDGNFTGPGDEHPETNPANGNVPNAAEGCIVCITKPVHIYSTQGAATTVIASDPQSAYGTTVMILSPGVDFGSAGHGFTLTGGNQYGVLISLYFPVLENISIVGNIDQGDGNGFTFYGYPEPPRCGSSVISGPDCRFPARILIANNQAIGNGVGFSAQVNKSLAGPIIFINNVALGTGTGFSVGPGFCCTDEAGGWEASQVQVLQNIASGGAVGFDADSVGPIEHNTAVNNSQLGFSLVPDGATFYGNSAIGNGGPGAIVTLYDRNDIVSEPEPLSSPLFSSFDANNFIDNDRNRPALSLGGFGINPGPSAHCGILIGIFLAPGFPLGPTAMQLAAGDNYWGSASGPSSSGSADAVGGACAQDGATTIATPYSKVPFPIGP
jgi:hypothetical protein